MPIRPEMRRRYPRDWPRISRRIWFERAAGQRECDGRCGRRHTRRCTATHAERHLATGSLAVRSVAHPDEVPEHCDDHNLMAMCAAFHLAYDAALRAANAARSRARGLISPGQQALFSEGEAA